MRLDTFLTRISHHAKTKAQAKEMCEKGNILLNGKRVKSSEELTGNDVISINKTKIRVIRIPAGDIRKKSYKDCYLIMPQGE